MSISDILVILVAVVGGLPILFLVARRVDLAGGYASFLYVWHTAGCVAFYLYDAVRPVDATMYYLKSTNEGLSWAVGTGFIYKLTSVIAGGFGLSKLSTFLVYNWMGLLGLLLLAKTVEVCSTNLRGWRKSCAIGLLLLPGLSFWTGGIGKDGIAFLASALAVYTLVCRSRHFGGLAVAAVLMATVRPHMALLLIGSGAVAMSLSSGSRRGTQLLTFVALFAGVLLALPFVGEYVGIGEIRLDSVQDFVDKRQRALGGTGLDLAGMGPLERIFSFLFRPLFFDASGALGLVSSTENLIVLATCLICGKNFFRRTIRNRHPAVIYAMTFVFVGVLILSTTVPNVGLAMRQKIMIFPPLYLLIALSLAAPSRKLRRDPRRSHSGRI
ncbi:hypothetical protein OAL29_01225 [Candidatus Binatia bacterium]|nr:hypothetical protein [Candidatus Binatia bacterium]